MANYKLTNYIGSGTFGKVFLCEDLVSGRQFAMKVQSKKKIDEQQTEYKSDALSYAISELNILKECDHPFIVKFKHSF